MADNGEDGVDRIAVDAKRRAYVGCYPTSAKREQFGTSAVFKLRSCLGPGLSPAVTIGGR